MYLKVFINVKGYTVCRISYKKNNYIRMLHRLIAKTWLKDFKDENDINHIDGRKTNNNILNLESITHKENMIHATKNNLLKNQHSIELVDRTNKETTKFVSIRELAKFLNVSETTIISKIKYSYKYGIFPNYFIRFTDKKYFDISTMSGKKIKPIYCYDIIKDKYIDYSSTMECCYETTLPIATISIMIKRHKGQYYSKSHGYILSDTPFNKNEFKNNTFKFNTKKKREKFIGLSFKYFNKMITNNK